MWCAVRSRRVPQQRQREEIDTAYYYGGMVAEASGGLHPARYHRGLAEAVRRAGALIVEETPVDTIARRAGGFTLHTKRGVVEAREVIVATNGYTGAVTPWLRRRLIPLNSYIIATEPLPPETTRRLIPRDRMIVAPFSKQLGPLTGPTDDHATIVESIKAIRPLGGTSILDSLVEVSHRLANVEGRRAIVLITDGYDEHSTTSFEEALAAVRAAGATTDEGGSD